MKKLFLVLCFLFFTQTNFGQLISKPNVSLKWNPFGLVFGNIGLQAEYNFGKNSLTAKIGIPVTKHETFQFDNKDADFNIKAVSFLAGYRTYLSHQHMRGLYFEPYFKYVYLTSDGIGTATLGADNVVMNFTNEYNGIGIGAQLGAQFLIRKKFVVDVFFLGPEINSANNNLKAIGVPNSMPWTSSQASQAEKDVKDFINKFPFVRNKTNVVVDENKKMVTANFNGIVPGFRIGVSFGFAF